MPQHHHTRKVSFTLLPACKAEVCTSPKHIIFIYGGHISDYEILPRQKRQANTFGKGRYLIAAVRAH
jgi:hypothetical protein